jgi:hypothetical protein
VRANAARCSADPAPSLPPESQLHDVVDTPTAVKSILRYQKILLPTRRSGQVPLYSSSAAKSDCMDYEEELDDNGVLRVRRVASPFVPIRDEREDEREAPRMAFDDDQMKAFRKVTLRKLQNQTRGALLTPCHPLATDLRPLRRNAFWSSHRLHPSCRNGHSAPLHWPEPNRDRARQPLRGGESGRPLS